MFERSVSSSREREQQATSVSPKVGGEMREKRRGMSSVTRRGMRGEGERRTARRKRTRHMSGVARTIICRRR